MQNELKTSVGEKFHVKNKYQQHEFIYRVMNSEKWAIFLILTFILVVASFNILGSLSMLIIDKKDDISILRSLGASQKDLKKIFLLEGWLISVIGAISGIILGVLLCWAQIRFALIKFPGNGSFAVPAYPVEVHFSNLILIFDHSINYWFYSSKVSGSVYFRKIYTQFGLTSTYIMTIISL